MNKKLGSLILGLIISGTLVGGLAVSAREIASNYQSEYRLSLTSPMSSDKVDFDIAKGEPARNSVRGLSSESL